MMGPPPDLGPPQQRATPRTRGRRGRTLVWCVHSLLPSRFQDAPVVRGPPARTAGVSHVTPLRQAPQRSCRCTSKVRSWESVGRNSDRAGIDSDEEEVEHLDGLRDRAPYTDLRPLVGDQPSRRR
jgi:hypothetical protein